MNDQLAAPEEVAQATRGFEAGRQALAERVLGGLDGLEAAEALTELTDAWVLELWRAASAGLDAPSALVGVGGYGRRELALGSDIDLVIEVGDEAAFEKVELRGAVERFMAWCREPRVKVAHAVRTPARAREEFDADYRTAVAYLDARPLRQPDALALAWKPTGLDDAVALLRRDDEGAGFVAELMTGHRQRQRRFGQTIYLLEPELKHGKGGMRDLHALRWAALVRWGMEPGQEPLAAADWSEEYREIYLQGRAWLMTVRQHLHAFHGRKHDRLNFRDQERLAEWLVEEDAGKAATEQLMRRHYREARAVTVLAERMLRRWSRPALQGGAAAVFLDASFELREGQIGLRVDAHPLADPDVFTAMALASEHDALLDPGLEMGLEALVDAWGPAQREEPALVGRFVEALTDPQGSARTSLRLLDLGVLTAMVPEFEPLVCHVQHDVYHVYTTDIHSLKCMEHARALVCGDEEAVPRRWPLFHLIAEDIRDHQVFLLAALFHDIGKNRGGGHSQRGAAMMGDIGARLNLSSAQIDQITFLVREHLALSDAARRYDLSDRRILRDLASRIRTTESLNQLTALTFCDMSTVGDDVMNDWNASLLTELYRRLRAAIEHGVEGMWLRMEEEVQDRRATLLAMVEAAGDGGSEAGSEAGSEGGGESGSEGGATELETRAGAASERRSQIDAFFRDVPASHITDTPPHALLRQFAVYTEARRTGDVAVRSTPSPDRGSTEIIVSAADVPGALATITGVLSASGLNILAAQIVTTATGRTLDIFQVAQSGGAGHALSPASQKPVTDPRRIDRLEERLVEVLRGEESVEALLKRRIDEQRLEPRPTPAVDTEVQVLTGLSDDFTVLEVRAPDRIGLLYEIASTLLACGVDIHVSKIDSLGTQVIDTFYVEDVDGSKLAGVRLDAVLAALREAVSRPPLRE